LFCGFDFNLFLNPCSLHPKLSTTR
jgi:hypothetical protein